MLHSSALFFCRWVRSSGGSSSSSALGSSSAPDRKDLSAATVAHKALLSNPAAMAHSREKAKRWVREQASRFLESYFKESLGSRHPALTILRRLSAQVRPKKDIAERRIRQLKWSLRFYCTG